MEPGPAHTDLAAERHPEIEFVKAPYFNALSLVLWIAGGQEGPGAGQEARHQERQWRPAPLLSGAKQRPRAEVDLLDLSVWNVCSLHEQDVHLGRYKAVLCRSPCMSLSSRM